MIICKIFNNNAIIARDSGKEEFVVMGRGIAFKKSVGEAVDKERIEKIFVLQQKEASEKFKRLLEDVPAETIAVCSDIIEYGKNMLGVPLSDYIYVTLTDHLHNVFRMADEGVANVNLLLWEIRRFYPKEFGIGLKSLEFIESTLDRKLPEDEAANIALHLINAQLNAGNPRMANAVEQTEKIQDILNIIKYSYNAPLNEQSVSYERFVTHLRFFFQRMGREKKSELEDDFLLRQVRSKYRKAYECAGRIEKYLQTELSSEERLYLTIHVHRVTRD
ncbi:PRD domain-containing protein [Saccharibacillus sp. CPCC 101409]|uniref:BglG family transcription antiterminator LicT n=1 Tax=Saccharibacillus sp. CPCC 101409 TaxID=3058041 RepID=UPI0026715E18|nr:PRD domain-containing protein [Saccharibacillus sp. CPCC 101409]MDO3409316.1 PRD domain-containing protein [Saccharibacillus sp. CPCC 101409]